jgi:hypothetical protein
MRENMNKIAFDPNEEGGLELARAILLERLRTDKTWVSINSYDPGFDPYVEYIGNDESRARIKLLVLIQEVFWEFIIQGIIAPGTSLGTTLPWFHITEYGKKVLEAEEFLPHDPTGYLRRFRVDVVSPDLTVEAYLSESLNCFTRGSYIASIVMLGVASERAFLLLCDSLLNALSDPNEKSAFETVLKINAVKPKEDWVLNKIQVIQKMRPRPLPDNVNIMLTVIFDFIRSQRNSLGHPQEKPPKISREEAYVNLRIFPGYYKMLNQAIDYLSHHSV